MLRCVEVSITSPELEDVVVFILASGSIEEEMSYRTGFFLPTPLCLYSLEFNWEAASFLPVFITDCTPIGISAPSHLQYPSTNHHSGGCVPPTLFCPLQHRRRHFFAVVLGKENPHYSRSAAAASPASSSSFASSISRPKQHSGSSHAPCHTFSNVAHEDLSLFPEKDMKFELQDVERARALEECKIFRALFSLRIVGRVSTHAPLSPPPLHPPLK